MQKVLESMFAEYGVSILFAPNECCEWVVEKFDQKEEAIKAVVIINQIKKKYGMPLYYPAYGMKGF